MPVDTPLTNEMERTPYVTESLRVRCPGCRKLYMVQFGDIQETKPRFECVQCRERFWLSLPDMDLTSEIIGIPLQVKEVPQAVIRAQTVARARVPSLKTEPCPKCFKANAVNLTECAHCGVLIAKARASELAFTEPSLPPHSAGLEAAWKRVIADFNDESAHIEFMKMAERERALAYAAAQYGQMQKLMPTDEVTQRKLKQIQALASLILPVDSVSELAHRPYARVWQLPLLGAAILIIAGLWIPYFRNLVGVGAAFLFLAVGLKMQLGRKG